HRALRVVFVGDRGAEHRHQFVSDDFVEATPERRDVAHEVLEAVVDQAFDLLRVGICGIRGEADEVGHYDGDEASLIGGGHQPLAAFGTEASTFGHRHTARRAGHGRRLPGRPRDLCPGHDEAFRWPTRVPRIDRAKNLGEATWQGRRYAVAT